MHSTAHAETLDLRCVHSRSLFERNYIYSTGGNIRHRFENGFLVSATNYGQVYRTYRQPSPRSGLCTRRWHRLIEELLEAWRTK